MTSLNASKLVALKLSSLNEADFNWIYSQLNDDIKIDLDPIIREIKEIGFDIDKNSINILTLSNQNYDDNTLVDRDVQMLDRSNYSEVAEVFKSESNLLFNTLLSIGPWKWEKDQNYIDKSKISSTKAIKHINAKSLLRKSITSTTIKFLAVAEVQSSKNKVTSKFTYINGLAVYFNKLIRPTAKW